MIPDNKIPSLPGERWEDIPKYEYGYMISDFGRVWSKPRIVCSETSSRSSKSGKLNSGQRKPIEIEGRILVPEELPSGYLRVGLIDQNGKRSKHRIHRLVASVYIANPENKPDVDHIDGNKQNNRAYNLRWVTPKENMQYAKNRIGDLSSSGKKAVRCVDTDDVFESIAAAARWATGKDKVSSTSLKFAIRDGKVYCGHVFVLESEFDSIENPEQYAAKLLAEYRDNTSSEEKAISGKKKKNWKHSKVTKSKLSSLLDSQDGAVNPA